LDFFLFLFCFCVCFCFVLLYVVSSVLGSREIEMMETQRRDDDKDGLGIEKLNNVHLKSRNREIKKEKQTTMTVLNGLPIQCSARWRWLNENKSSTVYKEIGNWNCCERMSMQVTDMNNMDKTERKKCRQQSVFFFNFVLNTSIKWQRTNSQIKLEKLFQSFYTKETKSQLCHNFFKKLHKCKEFPIISINVNGNEEGNSILHLCR